MKKFIAITMALLMVLTFVPASYTSYAAPASEMSFAQMQDMLNRVLDRVSKMNPETKKDVVDMLKLYVSSEDGIDKLQEKLKSTTGKVGEYRQKLYDRYPEITPEKYEQAVGLCELFKLFTVEERKELIKNVENGTKPAIFEEAKVITDRVRQEFPNLEAEIKKTEPNFDLDMCLFILQFMQGKIDHAIVTDGQDGKIAIEAISKIGNIEVEQIINNAIGNLEINGHKFSNYQDMMKAFENQINTRLNESQMKILKSVLANYGFYKATQPVVINPDQDVEIPSYVEEIKVEVKDENGQKVTTVPQIVAEIKEAKMTIPKGTKITGPARWNGIIELPKALDKDKISASVNGTVAAAIKVGLEDGTLTFDKAVRLVVPGQQGKDAAYIQNGTLHKITNLISEDNQATADQLAAGAEGKINVGNDLVIWTKHFTEFVAYTESTGNGSSHGGGGGGGSTASSATKFTVSSNSSYTFKKDGLVIAMPVNKFGKDLEVTVEKVKKSLPMNKDAKLASDVIEITKNIDGKFENPVKITIPYEKVDLEKYELGMYYLDEKKNEWIKLDNVEVNEKDKTVIAETDHFTKFAVLAVEKKVEEKEEIKTPAPKDVQNHWAKEFIVKLIDKGAVGGYPDGTFKPDNKITRAEFATIVVKAFDLKAQGGKVFEDTKAHWAKDFIATAQSYGIVSGYDEKTFGPDKLITREQMATMIVKAAKIQLEGNNMTFTDKAMISSWAQEYVAAAAKEKLVGGYPDGTFKPQNTATRAEAMTIIVNAME